jgi:hypothetical protein
MRELFLLARPNFFKRARERILARQWRGSFVAAIFQPQARRYRTRFDDLLTTMKKAPAAFVPAAGALA